MSRKAARYKSAGEDMSICMFSGHGGEPVYDVMPGQRPGKIWLSQVVATIVAGFSSIDRRRSCCARRA